MSDPNTPASGEPVDAPPSQPEAPTPPMWARWAIGVLGLLVVGLAIALVVVLSNGDDTEVSTTSTTTSTSEVSTTTTTEAQAPTTTTPSTDVPADAELATVVWPGPDSGVRYTAPLAAAEGFATELAGFTAPVVGDFLQGDSRSGEIEIRPEAGGAVTTVFVRKLSDGTWWVLGAATGSIEIQEPAPGDDVASPLALSGRSRAFEAVVNVSVFDLGTASPLGESTVMGSGDADLGPFSGEIDFERPATQRGVLLMYTLSARDGSVMEATAIPVAFG